MPNWTKEQSDAIYEDGTNILVSAGAGSGKTEVLSERALRKVKEGVNIDQILILTFTKAAAYEMMLRIREKIEKANLLEQLNRVDKAYITTFDSFALSIVKKYHDRINLVKDVSIIDANVICLLKKELLDEIFEEYYHQCRPAFEKLITDFCVRDDQELKKYILAINDKLDLKYDKNLYLDQYMENFYHPDYIYHVFHELEDILSQKIAQIHNLLKEMELALDGEAYLKFYQVLEPLLQAHGYDEVKSSLDINLPRLPKNCDEDVKINKEKLKTFLEDIQKICIFENQETMINEYLSTKEDVEVIIEIIQKLDHRIMEYKKENSVFEFTDISKLAIELVSKNPDIQEELKSYFNEIMIDEYQDTSDLQEKFIHLIENNNVYMVGDIKQSIYRFRNANPFIFKEKYQRYAQQDGGRKIDLNKNFRSRKEVLEDINYIFNLIMDQEFGGANYQESHNMVFGNQMYIEEGKTNQNSHLEIYQYSIEKDSPYSHYTKDEIEAFIIASDMKKKVESQYQVFDKKEKRLRAIQYRDFVILIDRSSKFTLYKKIFEYLNIPLTILKDENIADQNEIYLVRNLLKLLECVQNKDYENTFRYSFISIARSYLFSYPDQEIFHIMKNHLYEDTEILHKIREIEEKLSYLDLHGLLEMLINLFSFDEKLITIGNIQMGISVLEYLKELTTSLQELGYDYHQFIAYLDDIIQSDKEINIPISIFNENSCRIMTIHKSKGLEYPVCYYSGFSSSFNISDLKEKILYDPTYGIMIPSFLNGYRDTFYKTLFKKKYYLEEIGEKIRLFYVALTRCKEKMIIVANLQEASDCLENDMVSSLEKEQYRSFLDILKSIYSQIQDKIVAINLDHIPISSQYKILNPMKLEIKENGKPIDVSEYVSQEIIVDQMHFSKNAYHLMDKAEKEKMLFGTRIHELLESLDFKNPNFEHLDLSAYEKKLLESFLKLPILRNIQNANILKEYEFYMEDEQNQEQHGIIDLMLEYDDHIDIIDYKLKNIDDIAYQKQLFGYQHYIQNISKKQVHIYLYSVIHHTYKQLDSFSEVEER